MENIPHDKVHELYEKTDLAVDELLVGWYGAFAVEMMALGKPVVCYIREEELKKDKEYVLKKLGLADEEFEKIMNLPVKSHFDYKSEIRCLGLLRLIYGIFN